VRGTARSSICEARCHQACPEPVEGTADWILDLGPEGGVKAGEIVAEGVPEDVVTEARSYTGTYLKPLLVRATVSGETGGVA
jgi:hypothetical protein